jgi:hypothetical protein
MFDEGDYSSDSSIEAFTETLTEEFTDEEEEAKYQRIVVRREEGRKAVFIALKAKPFWYLRTHYPRRFLDQKSARWFHAMRRMKKFREAQLAQTAAEIILSFK